MSRPLSDRMQANLSLSLPLVRTQKQLLIDLIEVALRPAEAEDEPLGQSEVAAMILVQVLLDHAGAVLEGGTLSHLQDMEAEHRALGIFGRHYSRFGDALVPVLKDILGPQLPSEVASAWCDTFWAIIRAAQEQRDEALA